MNSLHSHGSFLTNGPHTDVMSLDFVELFAGRGRVSELAPRFGLRAIQPIDSIYGHNLQNESTKNMVRDAVDKLKPLLLVIEWPCTLWSLFSENLNYSKRMHVLEQLRDEDRPLVEFGVEMCHRQAEAGRLGENPVTSRIWTEPSVQALRDHPDSIGIEVECDAGAYGAEVSDGSLLVKPHRWITNSEYVANNLNNKLTPEQKMFATPIQGKETKRSGQYCDGLACAILDGLRKEASLRHPTRISRTREPNLIYYQKISTEVASWSPVLQEIEQRFINTHKKPFNPSETDPLMKTIQKLTPWSITRVQATWCPASRRFPADTPFTHRACVMITADDEMFIEDEDLSSVPHPKQRFPKAIRVGLFIFGMADDDEDEAPQVRQQDAPLKSR